MTAKPRAISSGRRRCASPHSPERRSSVPNFSSQVTTRYSAGRFVGGERAQVVGDRSLVGSRDGILEEVVRGLALALLLDHAVDPRLELLDPLHDLPDAREAAVDVASEGQRHLQLLAQI